MCPVVGFGPWLGLGKPLVEILPPGQLRGFCPLLAWLGSAVLGYGPVLSFGLVGPLLPDRKSVVEGKKLIYDLLISGVGG